jgi:hypothetical protein
LPFDFRRAHANCWLFALARAASTTVLSTQSLQEGHYFHI